MRINKLAILGFSTLLPAWADVTASSPDWHGAEAHFDARLEPSAGVQPSIAGAVSVSGSRISRIINDSRQKLYFGYDIWLRGDGRVFEIRLSPLSLNREQLGSMVAPGSTGMSLPEYPMLPQVRIGETVAIDLMVNPSTGQKIVDRISLRNTSPAASTAEPPRDLTLPDVELTFDRAQLSVNGSAIDNSPAALTGAFPWIYAAGHGRFVFSLVPRNDRGFRRAGEVAGLTLSFQRSGKTYRVDCATRIVPADGRFNLYVREDPDWRPAGMYSNERFLLGADNR